MSSISYREHAKQRLASGYIAGEAFSFAGGDRLEVKDAGVQPGNVSSNQAPKWSFFIHTGQYLYV